MKIAVLMGGTSEEREVSLASGVQVSRALREAGHEVVTFDTSGGVLSTEEEALLLERGVAQAPPDPGTLDLLESGDWSVLGRARELEGVDLLFPALHGGSGEDGTLQAILDLSGVPYAGSGRLGCTLAMDKEVSKRLFRDEGIPTPDWICWGADQGGTDRPDLGAVEARLGLPVIVKPPSGGSTLGLTLAHDRDELAGAVDESLRYERRVLFEAYCQGRELTVGIVGDQALPVGEIIPAHELFDYECKYQEGMAEEIFPADIPDELALRVQELALGVHRLLHLSDFSRVDFIVDADGTPWCLEANALPGLTSNSLLPKAARAAGIEFSDLCDTIVALAARRRRRVSGAGTRGRGEG